MLLLKTKTQNRLTQQRLCWVTLTLQVLVQILCQAHGQSHLILSDLDMILDLLLTFGPEKSENPSTIPHFDLM